MARTRNDFGSAGNARFLALVAQGWTAKAIAADLNAAGVVVSRSTIDTRMREVRGHVATPRSASPPSFARELAAAGGAPPIPPPVETSEALPTEADIEAATAEGPMAAEALLARIVRLGQAAETQGNLAVVGQLISREIQARDLIRKLTPPEKPDPNDAVDMVALGAEVSARFAKMVDMVLDG